MEILEHINLAPYTTLKVGGPARYFCEVSLVEDLEKARQFALQTDVPFLVLGSGSNLLISDEGFSGIVVLNKIVGRTYKDYAEGEVIATYGAGESLDEIIAETVKKDLWGIENLSHIPGTVGATPVQNVGAYGVEVSDLITEVTAVNLRTGDAKAFSNHDCLFGYRDSFFKSPAGREWCITHVSFRLSLQPNPKLDYKDLAALSTQNEPRLVEIRDTIVKIRSDKFPDWKKLGTAGSFFKNPIIPTDQAEALAEIYPDLPLYPAGEGLTKVSLGYILDKICDLKGYKEGDICLYKNQALVLINTGSSAKAVTEFANHIIEKVKLKTDITIEQEVTTV